MSGHGHHDADADLHAGHDDHPETTSDDFPADEPRSPAWLPLLGGALFLAGIFAFVVLGSGDETGGAKEGAAPAQPQAQRPTSAIRPGGAMPAGRAQPAPRPAP